MEEISGSKLSQFPSYFWHLARRPEGLGILWSTGRIADFNFGIMEHIACDGVNEDIIR